MCVLSNPSKDALGSVTPGVGVAHMSPNALISSSLSSRKSAMTPNLRFTDEEKSKMNQYLAKKTDFEEKRRILLQELEEVEARITEMQGEYGAIYNKRNPILRLPTEVTCLIFTLAQLPSIDDSKDDASEEDEEQEDEFLMEVIVSHVCRQWRTISLGFPKLWTSFYYEPDSSLDVPLHRFDTYVKRSAALPLRIWFDFQTDNDNPENVLLVEKAVEHAHRWQHFTMYSSDETVMQPLHLLHNISAPMLEYLTLVPGFEFCDDLDDLADDHRPTVMTSMDPHIFKGGAPKLTYLMLDESSMRSALPPLSNITILRIEKQNCDTLPVFERTHFLELLSLPSLSQLSLCGDLIEPFWAPRTIQMPNLKRFRVGEFDTIWDLLPSIRAPQLDTLIIHVCQFASGLLAGANPSPPDTDYSFPTLRKLYIIDSNVESSIAPAFTHLTSQATEVLISHGGIPTSLIRTIVNEDYADVVWPQLKILSCNIPDHIDAYLSFASSRPRGSLVLRLHSAMFYGDWDEGLQALKLVSSLELLDEWQLKEPFWPEDADHDFGKDDSFLIDDYV